MTKRIFVAALLLGLFARPVGAVPIMMDAWTAQYAEWCTAGGWTGAVAWYLHLC